MIIGGGVSAEAHRFLPLIKARPQVLPARLRNNAGIIGAAAFADDQERMRAGDGPVHVSELAVTTREPEDAAASERAE